MYPFSLIANLREELKELKQEYKELKIKYDELRDTQYKMREKSKYDALALYDPVVDTDCPACFSGNMSPKHYTNHKEDKATLVLTCGICNYVMRRKPMYANPKES